MSDKLTIDHYVAECFIKCANVILSSRVYQGAPIAPSRGASRWVRRAPRGNALRGTARLHWTPSRRGALLPRPQFVLSVDEVEGVAKEVEPWRKDTSSPMVIEVSSARGAWHHCGAALGTAPLGSNGASARRCLAAPAAAGVHAALGGPAPGGSRPRRRSW
jgi:hypothetical protein